MNGSIGNEGMSHWDGFLVSYTSLLGLIESNVSIIDAGPSFLYPAITRHGAIAIDSADLSVRPADLHVAAK